ncbi:unnamed protein product [Diplocarpon coronariae]
MRMRDQGPDPPWFDFNPPPSSPPRVTVPVHSTRTRQSCHESIPSNSPSQSAPFAPSSPHPLIPSSPLPLFSSASPLDLRLDECHYPSTPPVHLRLSSYSAALRYSKSTHAVPLRESKQPPSCKRQACIDDPSFNLSLTFVSHPHGLL